MKRLIELLVFFVVVACADQAPRFYVVTGPQGEQGEQGETGPQGVPGLNGTDGIDGTQITVVQLCSGGTSYPSTFPEVALCIDNKLYAVYSANGGFLFYMPEGAYSSNGVGNSCSFTVAANCEVVR